MTEPTPSPAVLVSLQESTVALLMDLRRSENETLDSIVTRCARLTPALPGAAPVEAPPQLAPPTPPLDPLFDPPPSTCRTANAGAYMALLLGERIGAPTLGKLFAAVVDAIHHLDPTAIERLAAMKARSRRFVSRAQEDVHAGRLDLPLLQTCSGWWVSRNIGKRDLHRALDALCRASGLTYRDDLRLDP